MQAINQMSNLRVMEARFLTIREEGRTKDQLCVAGLELGFIRVNSCVVRYVCMRARTCTHTHTPTLFTERAWEQRCSKSNELTYH